MQLKLHFDTEQNMELLQTLQSLHYLNNNQLLAKHVNVMLSMNSIPRQEIYLSNFIKKVVKTRIMRSILIVAKLMQHSIKNLLIRKEIPLIIWSPQSQFNLCTSSYIQPQKSWICRTA